MVSVAGENSAEVDKERGVYAEGIDVEGKPSKRAQTTQLDQSSSTVAIARGGAGIPHSHASRSIALGASYCPCLLKIAAEIVYPIGYNM